MTRTSTAPTYYPFEYYVGLRHIEDEVPSHQQYIGQNSTPVALQRSIIINLYYKLKPTEWPT
jgi:hypothetical protein